MWESWVKEINNVQIKIEVIIYMWFQVKSEAPAELRTAISLLILKQLLELWPLTHDAYIFLLVVSTDCLSFSRVSSTLVEFWIRDKICSVSSVTRFISCWGSEKYSSGSSCRDHTQGGQKSTAIILQDKNILNILDLENWPQILSGHHPVWKLWSWKK